MRAVRGSGTHPERVVRSYLHRAGLRFGRRSTRLPGSPDVLLPRYRTAVFVNGCFWHGHEGCRRGRPPKSNTDWWVEKVRRNRERDARVERQLKEQGWRVIWVWECQVLKPSALEELVKSIRGDLH